MVDRKVYSSWAALLCYPRPEGSQRVRRCAATLEALDPEARGALCGLLEVAERGSDTELEELFTRTFDNNIERALEVGWHLHGENYARGAFMVRMRALLRQHDIPEVIELPDHASLVLEVIARADEVLARGLASGVLLPALRKISEGFSASQNPYLRVIEGLTQSLERDFPAQPVGVTPGSSSYED